MTLVSLDQLNNITDQSMPFSYKTLQTGLLVDTITYLSIEQFLNQPILMYSNRCDVNYHMPLFDITQLKHGYPSIKLENTNQFIMLELHLPNNSDDLIAAYQNINLFNITPYFYEYPINDINGEKPVQIFGSTDKTINFFHDTIKVGSIIKVIFTFSETISDYFTNLNDNYLIAKMPSEFIDSTTFTFLIRAGYITGDDKVVIRHDNYNLISSNRTYTTYKT